MMGLVPLVGDLPAAWAQEEIFVANFENNSVTVYARRANGNLAPLRIIQRAATGFNRPVGLAVDTDDKGSMPVLAQVALSSRRLKPVPQAAPPPEAPVPPNSSRVTATVLNHSAWPPGSLENTLPPVPADQTLYSYTVEIHTSSLEHSDLESLATPGSRIEAFSQDVLPSDIVGQEITGSMKLVGKTNGVRWWISEIRLLPSGRPQ